MPSFVISATKCKSASTTAQRAMVMDIFSRFLRCRVLHRLWLSALAVGLGGSCQLRRAYRSTLFVSAL